MLLPSSTRLFFIPVLGKALTNTRDGVLNPSGIRFGSAEIYNALRSFTTFADAICVGQRRLHDADEIVLLFIKMLPGHRLTPSTITEVKDTIRKALSPRHVPKYVFEVPDIPYTINGKKIEVAVKQIVCGMDIVPSGAVANPEALAYYKSFYEIEQVASRLEKNPSELSKL
jgi:acetoacetyl-CoA synthetase